MAFRVTRTESGVTIDGIYTLVDIDADDIPNLIAELQHQWLHHRTFGNVTTAVAGSDSGVVGKP